MPLVRTKIEMEDVMKILRQKGYGVNRNRHYDLQLTTKDKDVKFKTTGEYGRKPMKGLSFEEVETVLFKSETPMQAALLFESMSKGEIGSAIEEVDETKASGLSAEQLAHIIDNGIDNKMEPMRREFEHAMAGMRAEMGSMVDECKNLLLALKGGAQAAPPVAAKKRRGRPPKYKRSHEEVEEVVKGMNLPTELPPVE